MEFLVAVMLAFLGASILWRSFGKEKIHLHTHKHNPKSHAHFHLHENREEDHAHPHPFSAMRKPFFVGMVHGLAGSAALMLLVLTTIPSPVAGLVYILIFGFGSVGGMLVLSSAIGLPFVLTARRFVSLNRWIRVAAGSASLVFGVFLGWELGFQRGLF
jgi:sulfite exporter TauE/SafE